MPVDLQTGVRTYQFVVDRLEERRGEQYPAGREEYEAAWTAAHDLEKTFAEAVNANDLATAESLLQELTNLAEPWRDHPDHPDNHDERQPRDAVLGNQE
ncbi:hypothetical protein ACF065_27095 [Streptomyces sp. NPDC015232]|uniref:hypothetical protein n=1 Tax=unclassified Streptomyces TaxID=2593676 RepID=UPI0036F77F00